ncbi:MAG: hypothetical protein SFZ24_00690 [Planctomycetota bacterium]|nr:hypothetical protein [Planctomycetota bacterium]
MSALSFCVCLMGGCAASGTQTPLRVRAVRDGTPVAAAHVRAIPISTSPVPLPVSPENLEQYTSALEQSGVTRADGTLRLALYDKVPHLVEVIPPALGEWPQGAWAWIYDPSTRTVTAAPEAGTFGPSPFVLSVGEQATGELAEGEPAAAARRDH